jgi:hypothetical protein
VDAVEIIGDEELVLARIFKFVSTFFKLAKEDVVAAGLRFGAGAGVVGAGGGAGGEEG